MLVVFRMAASADGVADRAAADRQTAKAKTLKRMTIPWPRWEAFVTLGRCGECFMDTYELF